MLIKNCVKCGNQFSYEEKSDVFTTIYRRLNCKICGTKYKVSLFCRGLFMLLAMAHSF